MTKFLFIKSLLLITSLTFVYGNEPEDISFCDCSEPETIVSNEAFQAGGFGAYVANEAEKNKDLIKRASCCLAKGDITNTMVFANRADPMLVYNMGVRDNFIDLVKDLYNGGYQNEALDRCKFLFTKHAATSSIIIELLFKDESFIENAIDLLRLVKIENVDAALRAYEHLINLGRPEVAEQIANEVLDRWVNEDKKSVDYYDLRWKLDLAKKIHSTYYYDKLLEQYIDTAGEVKNARDGWRAFERLIDLGLHQEAKKLANKLLEGWVNEDEKGCSDQIDRKLKLAKKIHSSYYYERLLEKYSNAKGKDKAIPEEFTKDSAQLKLKRVHDGDSIHSITDMLGSRLYIDPQTSERYDVPLESIQQFIETMLYEASKDSDIVFNILHAIALNVQNDPDFSLYTYDKRDDDDVKNEKERVGAYDLGGKTVEIKRNINNSLQFKGTIIHEMSHKLMDILYKNSADPYWWDNKEAKKAYRAAINQVESKLDEIKAEYNYTSIGYIDTKNEFYDSAIQNLLNVKELYKPHDQICEYIVRYPQAIAAGQYSDPKVHELMKPLADYWEQYIKGNLDRYINENGGNSRFISDYEREEITTPFVLNENNTTGLVHKIKMEKVKERQKYAQKLDLISFKSLITENPMNYFYTIKILEERNKEGDDELIKEVRKILPNLTAWRSLIAVDPMQYGYIISLLKENGDNDMVKALREELLNSTFWQSKITEDPTKYFEITEMLKENGDKEMVKVLNEMLTLGFLGKMLQAEFWNWYYGEEVEDNDE